MSNLFTPYVHIPDKVDEAPTISQSTDTVTVTEGSDALGLVSAFGVSATDSAGQSASTTDTLVVEKDSGNGDRKDVTYDANGNIATITEYQDGKKTKF